MPSTNAEISARAKQHYHFTTTLPGRYTVFYSLKAEEFLLKLEQMVHNGTTLAADFGIGENSGVGICQVRFPGCERIPETYRSPDIESRIAGTDEDLKLSDFKKDAIMFAAGKIVFNSF